MAKKEGYDELYIKLQDIIRSMEEEELNLEESMKAYEEGVKLVNKLHKILSTIEGKITVIKNEKEEEALE